MGVAVDFEALGGIDFEHIEVFVNRFGANVGFCADFRRDFVPGRACNDDANGLVGAAFHVRRQFDFGCLTAVEGEWVEG